MSSSNLVERTVRVLRVVAGEPDGTGLSEVARRSGIPKATCHRILSVLEREHVVALDVQSRRYHLAVGIMSIVGGLLGPNSTPVLVHQELAELARGTGETAGLDVLDATEVTVILQVQGPHLISQAPAPVPRQLPEWCTSTGKALDAWLPEAEVRRRLDGQLPADRVEAFLAELARVRQRGYGAAYDELEQGHAAVAVPIRVDGRVLSAVWIGGPTFRITRERIPELAARVGQTARRLEQLFEANGGWVTGTAVGEVAQPA